MNDLSAPSVSVILPILNEESDLENCITAILQQDYDGELEVILALGPSKDSTDLIAQKIAAKDKRVKLVKNPTGLTAAGLNLAIKASSFEIICRIDGHAEISKTYIKSAVSIMKETGAVNVGGIMFADSDQGLQRTIAQAMRSKLGVGPSKFHTGGGAGESETVYLGKTFSKLARQYFQYGRWRRVITRTHSNTSSLRYLAPPFAVVANLFSLVSGVFVTPLLLLPLMVYIFTIVIGGFLIGRKITDKLLMPLVLATMHMSWGLGFITSPKNLLKG